MLLIRNFSTKQKKKGIYTFIKNEDFDMSCSFVFSALMIHSSTSRFLKSVSIRRNHERIFKGHFLFIFCCLSSFFLYLKMRTKRNLQNIKFQNFLLKDYDTKSELPWKLWVSVFTLDLVRSERQYRNLKYSERNS